MIRWPKFSVSVLSKLVGTGATLFALAAPFVGVVYLVNEREELLREGSHEIMALGRLRVEQVSAWLDERMQDARFAQHSGAIAANAVRRASGRVRPSVPDWMRSMFRNGQYRAIQMFSPDGRLLASMPVRHTPHHRDSSLTQKALASRSILVDDLRRFSDGDVRMHLYAPLLDPRLPKTAESKGVVIFDIDPEDRLFPLMRSWPVPSSSARSILFRVAGDSVEFLDPQLRPDLEALSFRLSKELPELPAAHGARGYQGVLEGVDYRGEPVLAYVAPISGVDWWMVSKIDRSEVLARWQDERTLVILGSLFATMFAVTIMVLTRRWAVQRLREERTRHLSDLEAFRRHQSEIMELANDIVILADGDDRILQVNRMASVVYGLEPEQLIGRPIASLRDDGESEAYHRSFARLRRRGQLRYTAVHRAADGRRFDVEIAARHLVIDGRTYIQRIIRDVTDRIAYESELRRLNRIRRVLSSVNRLITRERDEAGLLRSVCSVAVTDGVFPLVWIGRANEDRSEILPVAVAGEASPHVSTVRIPLTASPTTLGFDGAALLNGTPVVIDDLERDVRGRLWRDDARIYGLRSVAILPVQLDRQLWGVVSFAATDPSYFTKEEMEHLEEIAADIAFALTAIRAQHEREAAERKLAEQQAIYRALFENSGEAVLLTRTNGTFISMNPEALRLFGLKQEDIPKLHRGDLADVTDPRLAAALEERRRTGRFSGELRLKRSDGTIFLGEVSTVLFDVGNGEQLSSMTIRDISSRRASEQLMESQLQELRRWHDLTLEREARVMELKGEVNALLRDRGEDERYPSVGLNRGSTSDAERLSVDNLN